ncbi:drug/metabolite exporter YedA [Pseudoxanthomonas composti]|uniref:Drug/metabolite exporter YedA n=1 Tax=Pseudoxanthomonas composti TaxID=2137479 RepID=A0A4Q1JT54_9GAMM|nr:drug/metabolite exporter YedA [Pseudoxanthomonas composti]RXR03501.1 drug/metabolite exporter YedA [Pseudoxanthomonas composti]
MSTPVSAPAKAAPGGWAIALALALVYVVWGSTYLGIHFALQGGLPPLLGVSGARFVVAGVLFFAVLRLRGEAAPTWPQWRTLIVMGGLLLGLGNGMVVLAEGSGVSSGLAAVAVASVPLWMGLFGLMRGHRPTRAEWIGIAIGFIGVVWLNAGGTLAALGAGLVYLLIAPVAWAYGSIWSRGRDLPSPFMTAAGQMICGGVLLCLAGLLHGDRIHALPQGTGLAAWLYLMLFGSIVAFTAYVWLLQHVRPALAGSYAYVNPVIAVALGTWLAQERFSAQEFGAMALIVAGVLVIYLAKVRRRP